MPARALKFEIRLANTDLEHR